MTDDLLSPELCKDLIAQAHRDGQRHKLSWWQRTDLEAARRYANKLIGTTKKEAIDAIMREGGRPLVHRDDYMDEVHFRAWKAITRTNPR